MIVCCLLIVVFCRQVATVSITAHATSSILDIFVFHEEVLMEIDIVQVIWVLIRLKDQSINSPYLYQPIAELSQELNREELRRFDNSFQF